MSIGDFNFALLSETEKKLPFYLIGAGFDFHQEQDPHNRPEGYPHYQWIQVVEGTGEITVDNKKYFLGENQGVLLFPDIPHEYHAHEYPWIVNWLTFNGYYIKDFLKQIQIEKSNIYSIIHPEIFSSKIHRALNLLKSTHILKGLEASVLVHEFLIVFLKYALLRDGSSVSLLYSRLNPVLEYIDLNFSKNTSIETMAEIIGVSSQYLCILFKKIIKQRPIEYLNNVRINKSKDILLKYPTMKIDDISIKIGYESTSYFCSIFRKIEGMSPGKFRALHLNQKYLQQTEKQ